MVTLLAQKHYSLAEGKNDNRSWNGLIYEAFLYDRVLRPSEIAKLAQRIEIEVSP